MIPEYSPSFEELEVNRKINEKDAQARQEAKEEAKRRREERKRNYQQMINENDDANEVILEMFPDLEDAEVPDLEDAPIAEDIAIDLAEEMREENDAELQNILQAVPIARSRRSRNIRPSIRLQESFET